MLNNSVLRVDNKLISLVKLCRLTLFARKKNIYLR